MGILSSRPLPCLCGPQSHLQGSYDFVVVGGGSAGACLAARLSEDPSVTVLLLEAGPDASASKLPLYPLAVTVPGLAQFLQKPVEITSRFDYHFVSTENPELTQGLNPGRKIFQPRGYIVGGSSCLNYMLWVRGAAAFYDEEWGHGWAWGDVAPFFRMAETYAAKSHAGSDRGSHGPTYVMDAADWEFIPQANRLFQEAAQKVNCENGQHPYTGMNPDYNNPHQPLGVGAAQWNIKDGQRQSTAVAYLSEEVRQRENLTISALSFVTRVDIEETACGRKRATGVRFRLGRANLNRSTSGEHLMTALRCAPECVVTAKNEIVLCGGALQSPQLLMLSGIGDQAKLASHGIHASVHLPDVGLNLQDHLFVPIFFEIEDLSAFGSGLSSLTGSLVSTLLFTSSCGRQIPDVQFHLIWNALKSEELLEFVFALPMNLTSDFFMKYLPSIAEEKPVCCLLPSLIQPKSRGSLDLYSGCPLAYPKADFKYLSKQEDLDVLVYACNLLRRIAKTSPLSSVLGQEVVDPMLPGCADPTSAPYAEAYVRSAATCIYHPVGTCAIGKVVDHELRVCQVDGLRVADASVMPKITPGNTNWPSIMIGERASSLVRATATGGRSPRAAGEGPVLLGSANHSGELEGQKPAIPGATQELGSRSD